MVIFVISNDQFCLLYDFFIFFISNIIGETHSIARVDKNKKYDIRIKNYSGYWFFFKTLNQIW